MQGIYCIENVRTGRKYIGSSVDVHKRINAHFSQLKKGTHHCKFLQSDFLKYGSQNFKHTILKETQNETDLILAEQYCISATSCLYNTLRTVGRKNSVSVKQNVISQYKRIWKKQLIPTFHAWYLVPLMFEYHSLILVGIPYLIRRVKAHLQIHRMVSNEKQILHI